MIRTHSVSAAATHLVPPLRDPERHKRLTALLRELWGSDEVAIRECQDCGFCFADPYVAATAEIYNFITGGHEHYPRDRFEFACTIEVLRRRPARRLLEIGAGQGAFIRRARTAGVARETVAIEYDQAALGVLGAIPGNTSFRGSVQELAATRPAAFDAICIFQVLEHMDRLEEVFHTLAQVSKPGTQLFICVPNARRVEAQERLTGFWDMPPNHIGRWTPEALAAVSERAGFTIADQRLDSAPAPVEVWRLAKHRWEARAYDPASLGARVNGISDRRVRGVVKRSLAFWDLLRLSPHLGRIPPQVQWFALVYR